MNSIKSIHAIHVGQGDVRAIEVWEYSNRFTVYIETLARPVKIKIPKLESKAEYVEYAHLLARVVKVMIDSGVIIH